MAEQETYEGWKNRETWAFWLHVTNDQGWYASVRDAVAEWLEQDPETTDTDYALGQQVVEYVKDILDEQIETETPDMFGAVVVRNGRQVMMMRDEIGSWWRIDHAEIGAAARELVSDS